MGARILKYFILFFLNFNIACGIEVNSYDEFVSELEKEGNIEVEINSNLEANQNLSNYSNKSINIKTSSDSSLNGANFSGFTFDNNINADIDANVENYLSDTGGFILNNQGTIQNLKGSYQNNHAQGGGGVVYNKSNIGNIEADFKNNTSDINGGAIYNYESGNIDNIKGTFEDNYAQGSGGAIFNFGNIGNIEADFKNNKVEEMMGGAIYNTGTIGKIEGNFENNISSMSGGAINNMGKIDSIKGVFKGNKTELETQFGGGGAISNYDTIKDLSGEFTNNSTDGLGGAIYNWGEITITAHDKDTIFSGNRDSTGNNAIYNYEGTINFESGEHDIIIDDKISGTDKTLGSLNINSGRVILNNEISNNTLNMRGGTLKFYQNEQGEQTFFGNLDNSVDFNYYSGIVDLQDGIIRNTDLGNLTLYNDLDLILDSDFQNHTSDTFSLYDFNSNDFKINVVEIIPLNSCHDKSFDICPVGENTPLELRDIVSKSIEYKGSDTIETPIYEYHVQYDYQRGVFHFWRDDDFDIFSPAILSSSIAAQLGGYLVQLNSYEEAFRNMNMYMLLPKKRRLNFEFREKGEIPVSNFSNSFYKNQFFSNGRNWIRPYSIFERVALKSNVEVSNVMYGSFMGSESKIIRLKKDFNLIIGPYVGYNGSHQAFKSAGINQNGFSAGIVSMFYRNNFYLGLTANAGASYARANTVFGADDFNLFLTGCAFKTGYNFEFKEGKFIIQPNYLMSYSFINTNDFTNASDIRIKSKPLNAIQIAPGIQFIANLENGWQPYLSAVMVFNCIDKTRFKANDVILPNLAIKPFILYGAGFRKIINDNFVASFQTYIANGARNGVGLWAGLDWAIDAGY